MDREWIMPVSIRAQSSTNLSNQATYERLPTWGLPAPAIRAQGP